MSSKPLKKKKNQQNENAKSSVFLLPSLAVLPVFIVFTAIFFADQLFGSAYFWEDFIEQAFPKATFLANHLADLTLPYWNSGTFNGMPFLADVQTGVFYPPNWLLVFGSGSLMSVWLLQTLVIAHVVFAQWSAYRLSRSLGADRNASVFAGVAYGFSGIVVCHMFHEMMVYHAAWFPLVLMFAILAVRQHSLTHAGYTGLAAGIMMLSGHPQLTLFCCTLIGLFVVVDALVNNKYKSVPFAFVGIILGGLIFCIQLLPSQELASLSERSEMTFEEASEGSITWGGLLTATVPGAQGTSGPEQSVAPYSAGPYYFYWETAFYFGIPALLFGLWACIRNPKAMLPVIVTSVFAVAFALGDNFFLYALFHELPLFEGFRMPARMMIGVALLFPVAAAISLRQPHATSSPKPTTLFASAGIVTLLTVAATQLLPDSASALASSFVQTQATIALFAIIVLTVSGWWALKNNKLTTVSSIAAVASLLLSLNSYGDFNDGTTNPKDVYTLPASAEASLSGTVEDLFRIKIRERGFQMMKQNQGLVSSVQTFEGYNPLLLKKRHAPTGDFQGNLDALNIKYDVAPNAQGQMTFVERPSYFPRFWMVYDTAMVKEDQVFDRMNAGEFDIREQAVLTEPLPGGLLLEQAANEFPVGHSIQVREYSDNKIVLNVETSRDGILSMSEVWYPAWKAKTPDSELHVVNINYGFRGIPLKKGSHLITMSYESETFSLGAVLTLLGVALSIGCVVVGSKRRTS